MQEKEALLAQIPDVVTRLRKLMMMSNEGRLRLEHVRIAKYEFGLPDDFEYSVVLKYPEVDGERKMIKKLTKRGVWNELGGSS